MGKLELHTVEVHIWKLRWRELETFWNRYKPILEKEECQKAKHYRFHEDKMRYLAGKIAVRMFLKEYSGEDKIVLRQGKYGKLYWKAPPGQRKITFNLSHSGEWVLAIFASRQAVGIDVQEMGEISEYMEIAKNFFTEEEAAEIQETESPERFYQYWAAREAHTEDIKKLVDSSSDIVWNSVPAAMELFIDSLDEDYKNDEMKAVLLSGDWINVNLPDKIKKHFPKAAIFSLGGATEASIWSIYYPIKKVDASWTSIPYGYPLTNQSIYILDSEQRICPPEVIGEIYIGGIGVAKGYINDEEKTSNSFVKSKYGRLYRTGDFGKYSREGYVVFCGRRDSQVKIEQHVEQDSKEWVWCRLRNKIVVFEIDKKIYYGLERKYTAKSVEFNIQTDRGNLSLRGYLGPIIWEGFFPEISNNENSKGYLFHPTIQTVDGEANYDCYINTVYSNSLASEIKKTERYIKRQENVASKMQQQILNIRCSQELLSKLNFSLKCKKEYHPLLLEELLDLRTESEIENIFDNFSQEYIQYSVEMRKKYWHKQYYSI